MVVSGDRVHDTTSNCLSEWQQSSGMGVDDSEYLVDRRRKARRSLTVVIVKLREHLQQTTPTYWFSSDQL